MHQSFIPFGGILAGFYEKLANNKLWSAPKAFKSFVIFVSTILYYHLGVLAKLVRSFFLLHLLHRWMLWIYNNCDFWATSITNSFIFPFVILFSMSPIALFCSMCANYLISILAPIPRFPIQMFLLCKILTIYSIYTE